MRESERRHALADFLRQRRARLSPADVGLPPGIRRRTAGLRREEVAQLANIGTSWYVWLEQGRDVVWRLFTSPTMQAQPNWEQLARGTLGEFRAASARHPGDQQFEGLIEDLKHVSSEFRRLWPHHDVRSTLDGHKVIAHSTLG